jgi:hypothetical protein
MERFGAIVSRVTIPAVVSFLAVVCLGSLAFSRATSEAVPMALIAGGFGILPTLLIGVPSYAALVYFRRAGFVTSAVVGAFPGLLLIAIGALLADSGADARAFGLFFVLYGVPVALGTHIGCLVSRSRMGAPNISLKRTNQSLRD